MDQTGNCPYCGSEFCIQSTKPFIYIHPPDFLLRKKYDIRRIFYWRNGLPPDVEDTIVTCQNCSNSFHVESWPVNPLAQKSPEGFTKISCNNSLFFENILDRSYAIINKIFRTNFTNYYILNTILVLGLFLVLIILPAFVTGSIEKLKYDYWFFVTPLIFILLLIAFKKQTAIIRNSLKYDTLPVALDEQYKKTRHYEVFNDTSIRCFIFGPSHTSMPGKLISPPVLFGLFICVIGFRRFLYFLPAELTVRETMIASQVTTHIYTSILFNLGYLLFHLVFWFALGTIIWISLITPNLIAKISRNIPLRINPLKYIGGTEVFGEVLLTSSVPIGIIALGVPGYLFRNQEVSDPTWLIFNVFLMSIFIIMIFFGFLYPLYPIHDKMRKHKFDAMDELTDRVDYAKIRDGNISREEINLNILRVELINRIGTKNEWPFDYDLLAKIILISMIPFVQLFISIYKLL